MPSSQNFGKKQHPRDAKSFIAAPEEFLIGALTMLESGLLPSEAVIIGASPAEVGDITKLLGVRHLQDLDKLPYARLRALLSEYEF